MAQHAGHIANMTNQLKSILHDVRIEAMTWHKNVVTDFRKCPFCATIWTKVEGCNGSTTCGKRPQEEKDDWSGGITASFAFIWDSVYERLVVKPRPKESTNEENKSEIAEENKSEDALSGKGFSWFVYSSIFSVKENRKRGKGVGCGKTITWSEMAPYEDDKVKKIEMSTKDVMPIQEGVLPKFKEFFEKCLDALPKLKTKKISNEPGPELGTML